MDKKSKTLRKEIINIIEIARRGHIGSALSILEIVRVLYEDILDIDPKRPLWQERDRFILSKGHGCLALYVILSAKGFFAKKELARFCAPESLLGGHPTYGKIPGIDATTGSLGHGLSIGIGMAINGKLEGKKYRTFVLLGDGECTEGSVWEAALSASKYQLDNLMVLVDYNKMVTYGPLSQVQDLEPFAAKWSSFGFATAQVDGHDVTDLRKILRNLPLVKQKPSVVICHTVKGKGLTLMENVASWHHKSKISDAEIQALYQYLELI